MTIQQAKLLPETPTEEMWGGLERDIVMWTDILVGPKKAPKNLSIDLDRLGTEFSQWLKDNPEIKNLDSVSSKGTHTFFIYDAMWYAMHQETDNTTAGN